MDFIQKAKEFLRARKLAYHQVFNPESVAGQAVLRDLAKFCRAHETTFHKDQDLSKVLQGRHEVWLRIQQHLNLTSEQLWKLYGRSE